jgi:hypothetical protein
LWGLQDQVRQIREAFLSAQPQTEEIETQTDPDGEAIRKAELVVSLSAQVAALQEEIDDNYYALDEARSDLENEKAVATEKAEANQMLQDAVTQLKDSLHVSNMKLKAANYEIDRLTAEWNKEREDVASLKQELSDSLKKNELLKNTKDGLKIQIEEEGAKVKELRNDNKELTDSLEEANTEINYLQNEIQYLHDSLRASGNNFEDMINKARTTSRMGRTGDLAGTGRDLSDEPDDMAYTMEFERDTSTPPSSAPVGVNGVRTIKSGRASANTSVADSDDYQDEFGSPTKPSREGGDRGVTFPDIVTGGGNGKPNDDSIELLEHPYDNRSSCEEDNASCEKSSHSGKSAGSKRKGSKKKVPKKPCSECHNRYKGKGHRLPTTLHNAQVEDKPHRKQVEGEMNDVIHSGMTILWCC